MSEKITIHDGGARIIRADYPVHVWSTGERNLWELLHSLTRGTLHQLLDYADAPTLAALVALFAGIAYPDEAAS